MSKTTANYEEMVRRSGLVPEAKLNEAISKLEAELGTKDIEPDALAKRLIEEGLITSWQNDKLMAGKHQGFFLGKYKLLRHLTSGGMSSVYLAEHVMMKRQVAIKVLPPARIGDSSFLERFQRECQVLASLDHHNIVRAHDFDVEGEKLYYMVLEYVDGVDLQRKTESEGPLDYKPAASYISQAASALAHAHEQQMVHRDMKPANLMLDKKGNVKVLDLGVARITNSDDASSLTLAHNEDVLGTADFLAPEQALNSHNVDTRADIYALGCTLYYMLTGHPPFLHKNLAKKLMAHQMEEPQPIRDDRPDLPDDLEAILNKMMAKKVDERYQTMEEVAAALDAYVEGKPIGEAAEPLAGSHPEAPSAAETETLATRSEPDTVLSREEKAQQASSSGIGEQAASSSGIGEQAASSGIGQQASSSGIGQQASSSGIGNQQAQPQQPYPPEAQSPYPQTPQSPYPQEPQYPQQPYPQEQPQHSPAGQQAAGQPYQQPGYPPEQGYPPQQPHPPAESPYPDPAAASPYPPQPEAPQPQQPPRRQQPPPAEPAPPAEYAEPPSGVTSVTPGEEKPPPPKRKRKKKKKPSIWSEIAASPALQMSLGLSIVVLLILVIWLMLFGPK